jgi:hypothetical protein
VKFSGINIAIPLLLVLICYNLFAQFDSSKYIGGSFDGFSKSDILSTGLNGSLTEISKFKGGSFDGFSFYGISFNTLGGNGTDDSKYSGGSYDGFSFTALLLTGLGGLNLDDSKFKGGAFDGFSLSGILVTGLNGESSDLSKFKGGSFDGFTYYNLNLTGLGGIELDQARYKGGEYDGYASVYLPQNSLGGFEADNFKFHGGSYDGFAVQSLTLIPLNGGSMKLKLGTLIEGFYDQNTQKQIRDTITVYLRLSSNAPYSFVDSAVTVPDSLGYVTIQFNNAPSGNYYIVLKHRNSIETWSRSGGEALSTGGIINIYDFTLSQNMAYGNNMILKGTRYCIYSGDVNRDGVIDGTDLALMDNDVSGFATGYIQTDITGDMVTDGSDLSITDNNVTGFVSVVKPPGAADIIILNGSKQKQDKLKK